MVKSRAIVKNCPKCDARVAVATKSCKCGYAFFQTRRSERIREAVEEVDERRRTSRVRREKPNYYDSQQFEKKKKKKETKVHIYFIDFDLWLKSHFSKMKFIKMYIIKYVK